MPVLKKLRTVRVLFVTDTADHLHMVDGALQRVGMVPHLSQVDSRETLLAALRGSGFDILLASDSVAALPWRVTLEAARTHGRGIPMILLGAGVSAMQEADCIQSGVLSVVDTRRPEVLGQIVIREIKGAIARRGASKRGAKQAQARTQAALARVAGTVAHELNNVLLLLVSNCELLEDYLLLTGGQSADGDGPQDCVERMRSATERGIALSRTLLDYASKHPLRQPVPQLSDIFATADEEKASPGPAGHDLAVVVDDEVAIRDVVEMLLRREGWDVLAVSSGAELWRSLGAVDEPPAVLVADVRVGAERGTEIADRFRRDYPGTKVILMSGMLAPTGLHEDYQFLPKPFSPGDFREVLASARRG